MKSWLKGGLWGIFIAIIYSIISIILLYNEHIFQFDFSLIVFPFLLGITSNSILSTIFVSLILAILFFIIGAIIGLIVGKIRGKNENLD